MSIELPLAQMTLAEKLEVMEALWADLSSHADQLPSPPWHAEVLRERKRQVDAGELKFLDWDTTIAELRNEMRPGGTAARGSVRLTGSCRPNC